MCLHIYSILHYQKSISMYPSRSLESDGKDQHIHHGVYHGHQKLATGYLYSHYIVWACLLAVSLFIVLYVIRLRRYVKPSTLRNVPSISRIFTQQDEEDSLLDRKDQTDYLFAHTKVYVG